MPCRICGTPTDHYHRRCPDHPIPHSKARNPRRPCQSRPGRCVECGADCTRRSRDGRCTACAAVRRVARRKAALIDSTTPYEDDERCRYVVACHPDGLMLDDIGDLLGITRERVRQIETRALERLTRRLELVGIGAQDWIRIMQRSEPWWEIHGEE